MDANRIRHWLDNCSDDLADEDAAAIALMQGNHPSCHDSWWYGTADPCPACKERLDGGWAIRGLLVTVWEERARVERLLARVAELERERSELGYA